MRVSKPIIVYVPSMLASELDKYLVINKPEFKYQMEYFYYLIQSIAWKQATTKKQEYVSKKINFKGSVSVRNINRYNEILKNGEFIISGKYNKKGKEYNGVKLNEKFTGGVLLNFEISPKSKFGISVLKERKNKMAHMNRNPEYIQKMLKTYKSVRIDFDEAEKWILEHIEPQKRYFYLVALNKFNDLRFRNFSRNKTNRRLDTNLTTLKTELRQFLIGDFVIIDLKNSQPFFLSILIDNIIKLGNTNNNLLTENILYSEIVKRFGIRGIQRVLKIHQKWKNRKMVNLSFNESVQNGTLYDDFVNVFSDGLTRDEAKDIMFKVLFSRNRIYKNRNSFPPYRKEKEIFAKVFPMIAEIIESLKEKDHTQLAIHLQQMESFVFIDCIARKLTEIGIAPLTIHDSIIVPKNASEKALKVVENIFADSFGVVPKFHVKNLLQIDL